MVRRQTLNQLYRLYKSATEAVLTTLFRPTTGVDKTCREIEQRVKQLKRKRRKFKSEFFHALRQAIFYRQQASRRYQQIQHQQQCSNDDDVSHDHFIELLCWIDRQLTVTEKQQEENEIQIETLFEHITIDEEQVEGQKIVEELQKVYIEDKPANKESVNKTLLDEKLTATFTLLHDVRGILDKVSEICDDVHGGILDNVTGSLLMSVAYSEVRSMCSYTALSTDNWDELDGWIQYELFEEFGLDKYIAPFHLSIIQYFRNVASHEIEISKLSSSDISQSFTDQSYDNDNSEYTTNGFNRGPHAEPQIEVNSYLQLDSLVTALQLLQHRRGNRPNTKVSPVENPALADLLNFLESRKPVAAISALFGLGMLLRYQRKQTTSLSMCSEDYHRQLEHCKSLREIFRTEQVEPQMLSSGQPKQYDILQSGTDEWTVGLCHAQLIGDQQKWELTCSHLQSYLYQTIFQLFYVCKILQNAVGDLSHIDSPAITTIRRLEQNHGYHVTGTTARQIMVSHKKWYNSTHSLRLQRLHKHLNNPQYCLVRLLIENDYRVLARWVQRENQAVYGQNVGEMLNRVRQDLLLQASTYTMAHQTSSAAGITLGVLPQAIRIFICSSAAAWTTPVEKQEASDLLALVSDSFSTVLKMWPSFWPMGRMFAWSSPLNQDIQSLLQAVQTYNETYVKYVEQDKATVHTQRELCMDWTPSAVQYVKDGLSIARRRHQDLETLFMETVQPLLIAHSDSCEEIHPLAIPSITFKVSRISHPDMQRQSDDQCSGDAINFEANERGEVMILFKHPYRWAE